MAGSGLVAEVQLHRLYPGGPAQARFIARHGPDREIVGGFSMTAPNSAALPQMMAQGVERMDRLFADAFAAGLLQRDRTLNQPEPPPAEDLEEKKEPEKKPEQATSTFQVQVVTPNAPTYNSALAHLRTVPGVSSVGQINIGIGNISNFNVTYRGDLQTMRAILVARGWGVDISGGTLRMYVVRPAAPAPNAQPGSAPNSPQPQPQAQPPAMNQSGAAQ